MGPVRPGQWYATDAELRAVNDNCCRTQGMYQYVVTPVEMLPDSEIADYRTMPKGSGPRSQDAPAGPHFGKQPMPHRRLRVPVTRPRGRPEAGPYAMAVVAWVRACRFKEWEQRRRRRAAVVARPVRRPSQMPRVSRSRA